MYPKEMLNLLGAIAEAFEVVYDEGEKELTFYGPLTLTISSADGHIATLYEEGWDFSDPKEDA